MLNGFATRYEKLLYLSLGLFTCLILTWVLYAKGFDIHIPRNYELDALFSGAGIKTIIDTGWIFTNPFLGAPLTYNLVEYPGSDTLSFLIIKILSVFSHDYAVVMNCFFFLTFPLTAMTSLFVFKRLGLRTVFAIVASLLFTFIPYHLMRGEGHLYLTTLYVIPVYVLLIISVWEDTLSRKVFFWMTMSAIFAASSGIYYAFFACYFLIITGILIGLYQRQWRPCLKAGFYIVIIMTTVIINTSPSLFETYKYGHNTELSQREANESETYGLKVSQMLLPVEGHRMHFMRIARQYYDRTAPLVNENNTATLGIIGSIGFIALLFALFIREKIQADNWYLLSRLNLSALLLGTIGGIGTMYAYLISPMIRSYNRISVFIAFFAIFSFFFILQFLLKQRQTTNKTSLLIALLVLFIGLADQVELKRNPDYEAIKTTYESDAKFVAAIEKIMPKNSMIFQLPITSFPENPTINKMKDYDLFKGYLHSHTLHWSYGALRGRQVIQWQKKVAAKPASDMLDELAYAGFTGIYIDRNGYVDHGKDIEQQLSTLLKQTPIVSEDNRLAFYDTRSYVNNIQNIMPQAEWYENILRVQHNLFVEARFLEGFDHADDELKDTKRWANKESATIRIVNYYPKSVHINVSFIVKTGYGEDANVKISGDVINEELVVNQKGHLISSQVTLTPGAHYIYIKTDAKDFDPNSERKHEVLQIEDLSV